MESVIFNGKKIRTIDIFAKEWRDKINGNSFFSSRVIVNLDITGNGIEYYVPFQYGYGDAYISESFRALVEKGVLPDRFSTQYWSSCQRSGIILRHGIERGDKKRDVTEWGRQPMEG